MTPMVDYSQVDIWHHGTNPSTLEKKQPGGIKLVRANRLTLSVSSLMARSSAKVSMITPKMMFICRVCVCLFISSFFFPVCLLVFFLFALGLGFGVWGLWFGVWGVGFRVWGLGFGVWGLGFGVWGLGFVVQGPGLGLRPR